ncbi:MAG: hypothetical protein WA144_10335, partial [Candidatus Methanoperedens sp.]
MEKLFEIVRWYHFLLIGIAFFEMGLVIDTNLQFSKDAYYYTLSSVFQGLFSILALAGIFILFRIEQLNKDEDKYETDLKEHLREIKNQTIPDLSSIGMNHHPSKDIMEWNEHNEILSLLGQREFAKYSNKLDKLKNKFAEEDKEFEEKLNKLKLEIEKTGKDGVFTLPRFLINIDDIENYRKEKIDALENCTNLVEG